MKQFWCVISFLAGSLLVPSVTLADVSPAVLLTQMVSASQSLNYEVAFINVSRQGIESLRYRHAIVDNQPYAQLLQMDGAQREIIQRKNEISYFQPGLEPFTISSTAVVDFLPAVIRADFKHLAMHYDFISVGRARIADQRCEAIRIVARDGTRYSYVVWLDSETKLLLRADLLDRDGETLEQYRVVSFAVDEGVGSLMKGLAKVKLPPPLSLPPAENNNFNWRPAWLPAGMKQIVQSQRTITSLHNPVESKLYSDGLFSFSINVSQVDKSSSAQLLRIGRRTVQTVIRNNAEITIVGEIPPSTSKRIADSINLGEAR